MKPTLAVFWQYLIPQRLVCRVVYRAARSRRRWFAGPLMRWFARHYQLDLDEAEHRNVGDYESLNALFTRGLRRGARPIAAAAGAVVAPADGRLTQCGRLDGHTLIQAKGMTYALPELVGRQNVDSFANGSFATIYLAPHNYHRVHLPLGGRLTQTRYIPGARFAVNAATSAGVPGLFCRNERAVLSIDAGGWDYFLVLVGALNVSSISTVTRGEIPSGRAACWAEDDQQIRATGSEIGRFNLGSTVVAVFPPRTVVWRDDLVAAAEVQMGQQLGSATAA